MKTFKINKLAIFQIVLTALIQTQLSDCSLNDILRTHYDELETVEKPEIPSETHQIQPVIDSKYNPVLFIPGDGGSQLEAKLNKTKKVHYICDLVSDWYDIWLNIHLLSPVVFDCLIDNMRLYYNKTSRATYNSEGVEIRPTNFGSIDSVDYLDIYRIPKTDYFDRIISTLETRNGFVRNVDMVAAPFDFRKAPNELDEFFDKLKQLIEDHYVRNNFRRVTIICHSMGCLNSLYLLNRQTKNWKDVFIQRLITLAAPWDGSFKAISAMLNGDNLGIPLLNKSKLQALQSSFPSLMYLFPKQPTFGENRTLVQTDDKNYTLTNLDDLFKSLNLLDQMEMWHDTREIAKNLTAPNVELWCLYGSGVATPSSIVYDGHLADNKSQEIQGDGDGTVNLESLRACEYFRKEQLSPVYTREFEGVNHIDILRGTVAADFISDNILQGDLSIKP